jgi:hypothetical protein
MFNMLFLCNDITVMNFFSRVLFNYYFSSSAYIALNDCVIVNNELEMMWKESAVTLLKVLSQYFPGGT